MQTIFPKSSWEPLELLARCNGYYECPKDPNGKRLGPLVGYAAKYDGEHQWVGDVYANFAKAERHAPVLYNMADRILKIPSLTIDNHPFNKSAGFCGVPEGGKALANALAIWNGKQYIFPEKQVTVAKTKTSREVSELRFDRHEPETGEIWWIVEDVCNNFSTTEEMIRLIHDFGARVAGIICFLNRSLEIENQYCGLPVIALVRKKIPQYRQDDPFVAEDVRAGNIIWKPKIEWDCLAQAMESHHQ